MTAKQPRRTKSPAHAGASPRAPTVRRTPAKYLLRLFVAGAADRSRDAVLRVRRMCETELKGLCDLEVIDIYQQPEMARLHQIVATPTLIRERPKPARRYIGSLADVVHWFTATTPPGDVEVVR